MGAAFRRRRAFTATYPRDQARARGPQADQQQRQPLTAINGCAVNGKQTETCRGGFSVRTRARATRTGLDREALGPLGQRGVALQLEGL